MLQVRGNLTHTYDDVLTSKVIAVLNELAPLDVERRALMQARLDRRSRRQQQKERIRRRIAAMLIAGYLPREFRQYAKLGCKIGLGELLNQIKGQVPLDKPWVQRYFAYLEEHASH